MLIINRRMFQKEHTLLLLSHIQATYDNIYSYLTQYSKICVLNMLRVFNYTIFNTNGFSILQYYIKHVYTELQIPFGFFIFGHTEIFRNIGIHIQYYYIDFLVQNLCSSLGKLHSYSNQTKNVIFFKYNNSSATMFILFTSSIDYRYFKFNQIMKLEKKSLTSN